MLAGIDDDGESRLYVGEADVVGDRLRSHANAKTANQWVLENTAAPNQPPLSEADRADADWFLDEMLLIYPILGIDAFEAAASDPAPVSSDGELIMRGRGVHARGRETKDGFVVLAGGSSNGRKAWKTPDGTRTLKQLQDARTGPKSG